MEGKFVTWLNMGKIYCDKNDRLHKLKNRGIKTHLSDAGGLRRATAEFKVAARGCLALCDHDCEFVDHVGGVDVLGSTIVLPPH